MIEQLQQSPLFVKIFYAYVAVSLGQTGLDAVDNVRFATAVEKVSAVEKRLERLESLIIDVLKSRTG